MVGGGGGRGGGRGGGGGAEVGGAGHVGPQHRRDLDRAVGLLQAHTRARARTHTHTHTHARMHARTRARTHTHTHAHTHEHTQHSHTRTHTHQPIISAAAETRIPDRQGPGPQSGPQVLAGQPGRGPDQPGMDPRNFYKAAVGAGL